MTNFGDVGVVGGIAIQTFNVNGGDIFPDVGVEATVWMFAVTLVALSSFPLLPQTWLLGVSRCCSGSTRCRGACSCSYCMRLLLLFPAAYIFAAALPLPLPLLLPEVAAAVAAALW